MTPLSPAALRTWAVLCGVLGLGAVLAWFAPHEWLDWQPTLVLKQPWRLWSAAWVHWSVLHLMANLAGCCAVAAFGIAARAPRHAAWAWLAAWPLTHAALALQPLLLHYGGLSGVLHAGVAIAASHLAWCDRGRRRAIGYAVLAGLAAKLVHEQPWVGPTQEVAGWDIRIAPLAHLSGAVAGLLSAAAARLIMNRRLPGARMGR